MNSTKIDNRIKIHYKYDNLQQATKDTVVRIVELNINGKLDRYLKKVLGDNEDAELLIDVVITKNKKGKYEGHLNFMPSPNRFMYRYEVEDFQNLDDLINHAFDHYKKYISDQD